MTQQELQAKQENLDKLRMTYDVIRDILSGSNLNHFVKTILKNFYSRLESNDLSL